MEGLPVEGFKKETIQLEDGRYLIFYDFGPDKPVEKPAQPSSGKDEK